MRRGPIKYFKKKDLYCYLKDHGSLDRAMENSRKLAEWSKAHPEDHIAYSEVHELLAELEAIMEEVPFLDILGFTYTKK